MPGGRSDVGPYQSAGPRMTECGSPHYRLQGGPSLIKDRHNNHDERSSAVQRPLRPDLRYTQRNETNRANHFGYQQRPPSPPPTRYNEEECRRYHEEAVRSVRSLSRSGIPGSIRGSGRYTMPYRGPESYHEEHLIHREDDLCGRQLDPPRPGAYPVRHPPRHYHGSYRPCNEKEMLFAENLSLPGAYSVDYNHIVSKGGVHGYRPGPQCDIPKDEILVEICPGLQAPLR